MQAPKLRSRGHLSLFVFFTFLTKSLFKIHFTDSSLYPAVFIWALREAGFCAFEYLFTSQIQCQPAAYLSILSPTK